MRFKELMRIKDKTLRPLLLEIKIQIGVLEEKAQNILNWQEEHDKIHLRQLITAKHLKEEEWAALERGPIIPETLQFSQSVQTTTENGPAEQDSDCVHLWAYSDYDNLSRNPQNNWGMNWCQNCGALWSSGEIRVPAVTPTPSTSVKPDTNISAEAEAVGSPQKSNDLLCSHPIEARFHFYQENVPGMAWWCQICGALQLRGEIRFSNTTKIMEKHFNNNDLNEWEESVKGWVAQGLCPYCGKHPENTSCELLNNYMENISGA